MEEMSHSVTLNVTNMMEEEKDNHLVIDCQGKEENDDLHEVKEMKETASTPKQTEQLGKLVRVDSFDKEASKVLSMATTDPNSTKGEGGTKNKIDGVLNGIEAASTVAVMQLAFQSLGVVYGDIGTSPLYVFSSTFSDRIPTHHDILGALSLIIYSLTLFPLIKYIFIVLRANENGDGGTFAMYSLISRHSRVSVIPNTQAADDEMSLSTYKLKIQKKNLKRADKMKKALESSSFTKACLLTVALLGTCMVIGDGILTPSMSVLSAVDGVRKINSNISKDVVAMISVAILIVLFSIQRFGTDKVGYTFAPAILLWYLFIGVTGVINLIKHESMVIKAFNPIYIFKYFNKNPKEAWISLGGIVLCMTGTEAMSADLGHFSVRSIQIAFTGLVYPCLLCAYVGQAAYLSKFPENASDAFYKSTPDALYWPMFAIAVLASIIASQAMISASFSIVKQSMALGCFPRVRVVHTSHKHEGQVYIPEINFLLMFACVLVTAGFKETTKLGNAYGIAVVAVMLVTSSLLVLIMLMIWQTNLLLIALFIIVFGSFELLYFSSVLYKFDKGGYLPLLFAGGLFFVMYVWHYVQSKRYTFEVENKVSTEYLATLGSDLGITRVPGVGLLYTELTQGIPAIFSHFLKNLPAIHSVLVFVSVKYLHVNKIPARERFMFRRVGAKEYKMYRCIARFGYRDRRLGNEEFENLLMELLKSFIMSDYWETSCENNTVNFVQGISREVEEKEEIEFLEKSRKSGVVYMLGHGEVKAGKDSCLVKKFVVNYAYDFLRRNSRQGFVDLQIPNEDLLQVGMNYYI